MVQPLDRAAFLAALQAAAQPALQAIELPGIGRCFKRTRTVHDLFEQEQAVVSLKQQGLDADYEVFVAVGLAQALCDEAGKPLLNPSSADDIRLILSLPSRSMDRVLRGGGQVAEGADPNA